ncbi:MAG: alpha/beta fold hydrolase [Alphaproteobacteria bacterium]|nr:alpha/beta fold hydrolase [Alphaproteobacteria bacterium]
MPAAVSSHKVRDVTVRMMRQGSGPPLLYLHGANGLPPWLPMLETLSRQFEVIVPEHPGFGLSDNPPWIRNVGDLAMYYLDFIEALSPHPVNLVGLSLGGWVAAEVAVRNCTRLATLSLLAPAGLRVKGVPMGDNFIWDGEESVRNLYHDQSLADRLLAQAQSMTDDDADLALTNRFAAAKFGWEPRWFNPGLERWLHRISVRTLIVWGDDDKLFPAAYAARWGERIPGSRVEIIPDCGHGIALEKPDAAAKEIMRLIAGMR